MIYYHGTSYEAAMNIIKDGFNSPDTIWSCSDDCNTYIIHDKYFDDDDYDEYEAVEFAISAARISAAYTNSKSDHIAIIIFDIPEDIAESYVLQDSSCENMPDCYQIDSDDLNDLMDKDKIAVQVRIFENSYNQWLRPFYLAGLNKNYMCIKDPALDAAVEIIESSKNIDYLYDVLYENCRISDMTLYTCLTTKQIKELES